MAMAGGLGMKLDLTAVGDQQLSPTEALFSESNTRFLIETSSENAESLAGLLKSAGVNATQLGTIESGSNLSISSDGQAVLDASVDDVKRAWIAPLDW
jgi:phosphoribosylformylglycinamidine synthase